MSDFWKSALPLVLIAALAFTLGIFVDRGCVGQSSSRDTVTVINTVAVAGPHVTLLPNPVTMKPQAMTPAVKARIDSLIKVTENKNRLIEKLLQPIEAEQQVSALSPEGFSVTGKLYAVLDPMYSHLSTNLVLDSLHVPIQTMTITKTEVHEVWKFEYIVGAAAVGIITGLLIHK